MTRGSCGIGAAIAYLAAEQGYAVCVNYLRSQETAQSIVRSITQKGGKAIAVAADVASQASIHHPTHHRSSVTCNLSNLPAQACLPLSPFMTAEATKCAMRNASGT